MTFARDVRVATLSPQLYHLVQLVHGLPNKGGFPAFGSSGRGAFRVCVAVLYSEDPPPHSLCRLDRLVQVAERGKNLPQPQVQQRQGPSPCHELLPNKGWLI